MKKVLLACPVSDYKHYIIDKWIEHIKQLTYKNVDILLIDNSHDELYWRRFYKHGITCKRMKPKDLKNNVYMAKCNELIRLETLRGKYDYLFSLECDIFPPYDIIEYLIAYQKPVVSASYFIGEHFNNRVPMIQKIDKHIIPIYNGDQTLIERQVTNIGMDEGFKFFDGHLKRVFGCGIGCALIHREVLEKVKFHVDKTTKVHADSFFYQDLAALGIPVYLDTSLIVQHYNTNWNKIFDSENKQKIK